jgi:hypothetical protein
VKAEERMAVGKKTANQVDSKHEHTDTRHLLNHEVCKGSVGKRNGRGSLKSKSRAKTKGERLHGDTAEPNEQNLKEQLITKCLDTWCTLQFWPTGRYSPIWK